MSDKWILSKDGERLLLFGGGPKPHEAIQSFIHWCGDQHILLICWASREPELAAQDLHEDFVQAHVPDPEVSLDGPKNAQEKTDLLQQIERAGAIFFSGGDQNRIMQVLRDQDIKEALHAAYLRGVPFGGTSAGTAVMSLQMIAGQTNSRAIGAHHVKIKPGLGILRNVLLDQHFLKRKRQNRLFGAILGNPELLGIGVDEGGALAITQGRYAQVVGPEKVMIVDGRTKPGSLVVDVLEPGESFDLLERRRLAGPPLSSPSSSPSGEFRR